jgi:predicted O-methyltransferase YrrM
MPLSTARVATERPERYIKQLVSHLGHKADATLIADGRGTITFGSGAACALTPAGAHLELIVKAPDGPALAAAQDVVGRHLIRFATQEELAVDWSAPIDGGGLEIVDPVVSDYVLSHCTPADEVLSDLVIRTREVAGRASGMQVAHDEGVLLTMLARMVDARFAVEVGVFTGYSSVCIARALPADGRLLACDISHEWTAIAQEYWQRAGVADRIDLKIGPAIDTLRALPADASIDFAFIDADKGGYDAYYEEIVRRLRPGGLVVLDNVLLGGRVVDPTYQEEHHQTMRRLNDLIAADDRVESVMLPVRDGVTLARKR